ncbi:MAG: hypothetical protein COA69_11195 [Robiginitomaculum sp.]|nr:MAG: hypothetical protein COA69_11195 [Robiginitomaculum sp.]
MKTNVGSLDRGLRLVFGGILIALAYSGHFSPWGWIGIVPVVTALIGWCPAYRIFGLNSCPVSKK